MHVFLVSALHVFQIKLLHHTGFDIVLTKIQENLRMGVHEIVMTIKRGVWDQKNTGHLRRSAQYGSTTLQQQLFTEIVKSK